MKKIIALLLVFILCLCSCSLKKNADDGTGTQKQPGDGETSAESIEDEGSVGTSAGTGTEKETEKETEPLPDTVDPALIGDWMFTIDIAGEINKLISESGIDGFKSDSFPFVYTMCFSEDSVNLSVDVDEVGKSCDDYADKLNGYIKVLLKQTYSGLIAELDVDMTLDELASEMSDGMYKSIDEFIDSAAAESAVSGETLLDSILESVDEVSGSCFTRGNVIYIDGAEELTYSFDGDRLLIDNFDEPESPYFPAELTRK